MNKKTLITLTVIIVVAILLAFLYVLVIAKPNPDGTNRSWSDFFPFGQGKPGEENGDTPTPDDDSVAYTDTENIPPPRKLVQLSSEPVAGATVLNEGIVSKVRYVDRSTGHIYEIAITGGGKVKISNTTVPKVHEAMWTQNGAGVIMRYLREGTQNIETFYAKLSGSLAVDENTSTGNSLEGSFLPPQIDNLAVSPKGDRVIFVTKSSTGASASISAVNGTGRKNVFTSSFSGWLSAWPKANTAALTSKPTYGASGALYFVNTETGNSQKILDNVRGLTSLVDPTASSVLYSTSRPKSIALGLYRLKGGGTQEVLPATLPEKCVWSRVNTTVIYCAAPGELPPANYPDDWYQGLISFNDDIWEINLQLETHQVIGELKNLAGQNIDAINLTLSPDENYLIFMNKKDLTLGT